MSPKFTNQQKAERAERAREIIKDFMHCETIAEFNELAETYKADIKKLKLTKCVAGTIKRLLAVKTVKDFDLS